MASLLGQALDRPPCAGAHTESGSQAYSDYGVRRSQSWSRRQPEPEPEPKRELARPARPESDRRRPALSLAGNCRALLLG